LTNDSNTLTAWWVVVTILLFIVPIIYLFIVTKRLKQSLTNSTANFSEENIIKDKLLKNAWIDYSETLLDLLGERKTDEYSYDYFSEVNLLSNNTNLKLLNYIPSALVGLGILGTFVGLTAGVSNFKTENTDAIKNSIEVLLSGMGTAFVSSIWGMLLSLVYTFIEKIQIHSLHNSLHALCYKLDKTFKVSKEDERRLEQIKQHEIISEYFIYIDENDHKVKPANVFRDLYNESVKQSAALQTFSTDLAVKIEAGFETILSTQIQKGVIPELQLLRSEIETLGKKIQAPASEMTQSIVNNLETAMEKMIQEFKTSVSGSAKTELENIASLLGNAGGALNDFPGKLQAMTDNLNTNFQGLQEVVQQIAQQTLVQSNESTGLMRKQVEEMSEILKNKIGDLQGGQEILMNKQNDNLQLSEKLFASFNVSIETMNGLSDELSETISQFSEIQDNFTSVSGNLKSISDNVKNSSAVFNDAHNKFSNYSKEFLDSYSKTIEEIEGSLDKAKDVSSDYAAKFVVIEKGLKSIFEQIQTGLDDYGNTISESTKVFLDKYSEALTKTAESLAAASAKQEDLLDELTDILSKKNLK
jgi:ABC-type transporter Mla subunit MlaD